MVLHIPASQRLTHDVLWHLFGYVSLNDSPKGPMAASRVSRRWRLAALHSPFIWSSITIRLYTSSQQHLLALACFERSRNVPITLTIHATRHFKSWEKEALLLPHAHRFRSLHVKASAGSLANILWAAMDMPMPRLEVFETMIANSSRLGVKRKIVNTDENANIIPPIFHHNSVDWGLWNVAGLTALTLDTTHLWNKPDLNGIYHALANTCNTLQSFEYQGFVPDINAETDTPFLEFSALRSLTVICHDDIVPLLRFMSIPALDSLTLRDFIVCPTSAAVTNPMDMDERNVFDPDGFLQIIKQWTSITRLKIFGIADLPSDDLPRSEWLDYIGSLKQLSSLVLYGIGAATSIAHTLFMYDPADMPLLPKLSRFLLAISEALPNDDLYTYAIVRQRHKFPRLQKLTIDLNYFQHLEYMNRFDSVRDACDNFFIIPDWPVAGEYRPIKEMTLPNFFSKYVPAVELFGT